MVKACSIAMKDYPLLNSIVDNEVDVDGYIQRYVIKKAHNFSIAIDSKDGLKVPNVKDVQTKSILQIDAEIKKLIEKANSGGLTAEDFTGATFGVTSTGNIGGRYLLPFISRPKVAIIGFG